MKKLSMIITIMIISLIGITSVNATTVNYTYKKSRVEFYSLGTGTTAWSNWNDFDERHTLSSGYGVETVAVRFGWSSKFQAGTTYRVVIHVGMAPSGTINGFLNLNQFGCFGSNSTSNWSNDASLIASCNFIGATKVPEQNQAKYIFDITPLSTIIGIQINMEYSNTEEITGVNVYSTSSINYGEDATGAIDNQTIIIQEEFNNITDIINQNNDNLINAITEENEVCQYYDKGQIKTEKKYLTYNGGLADNNNIGITDYINIIKSNITVLQTFTEYASAYYCTYTQDKVLINCYGMPNFTGNNPTIDSNATYIRVSINTWYNKPSFKICKNGNQAILDADNTYENENISEDVDNEHEKQQEILGEIDDSYMESEEWEEIGNVLNSSRGEWLMQKLNTTGHMNQKVFLSLTTVLALGIIKMILGR